MVHAQDVDITEPRPYAQDKPRTLFIDNAVGWADQLRLSVLWSRQFKTAQWSIVRLQNITHVT